MKLTTYRRHAAAENRPWIQAMAWNVAATSLVSGDGAPPERTSARTRACTALCCLTSSSAR